MTVQGVERTNQIIYIMLTKICISNTVVEFYPSASTFKKNFYRGGGVLTLGAPLLIRLLNVYLQTWLLQCNHIIPSDQFIWMKKSLSRVYTNKTTIILIIRMLRPIKDHQIVIEQQTDPPPNVSKASDILLISGDADMVQNIISINKSGLQEIFDLWRK